MFLYSDVSNPSEKTILQSEDFSNEAFKVENPFLIFGIFKRSITLSFCEKTGEKSVVRRTKNRLFFIIVAGIIVPNGPAVSVSKRC